MNPALLPLVDSSRTLIIDSLATSTLSSYWTAWQSFRHFHNQFNLPFPSFDLITLTSYITYSCTVMSIRTLTIKVYLSGIAFFSKLLTGSPGQISSHPQVVSLLRGLQRREPAQVPRRLPLTADLLAKCIGTLRSGYSSPHVSMTLEAMFILAFFGFLRCSEFTSPTLTFDPRFHACIADLSPFTHDTLIYHIKRSKSNQFGPSIPIFIFNFQSSLNPFETLSHYLSYRKSLSHNPSDPLFITESGHVASRQWFLLHLRNVFCLSGISPTLYSGHSFRIGAATSASRNGVPDHLIKIMGRWSSQAYLRYIRSDLHDLKAAQSHLLLEALGVHRAREHRGPQPPHLG